MNLEWMEFNISIQHVDNHVNVMCYIESVIVCLVFCLLSFHRTLQSNIITNHQYDLIKYDKPI